MNYTNRKPLIGTDRVSGSKSFSLMRNKNFLHK